MRKMWFSRSLRERVPSPQNIISGLNKHNDDILHHPNCDGRVTRPAKNSLVMLSNVKSPLACLGMSSLLVENVSLFTQCQIWRLSGSQRSACLAGLASLPGNPFSTYSPCVPLSALCHHPFNVTCPPSLIQLFLPHTSHPPSSIPHSPRPSGPTTYDLSPTIFPFFSSFSQLSICLLSRPQ